jgi:hypothetical protein
MVQSQKSKISGLEVLGFDAHTSQSKTKGDKLVMYLFRLEQAQLFWWLRIPRSFFLNIILDEHIIVGHKNKNLKQSKEHQNRVAAYQGLCVDRLNQVYTCVDSCARHVVFVVGYSLSNAGLRNFKKINSAILFAYKKM